ncbi:GPP34 family phosphoprotein [Streptomyces sp. NPDC051173]|uniref:GOLPH3/VPS74 family protein n=1 Tax=Streptomyces sp. NPDC051173 TaxID=3155164 RepID=UPI00344D53BF
MTGRAASDLTLPEELLLLSFDPATGRRLCRHRFLQYGVAGAVLVELELAGRIVEEHGRPTVTNPAPPRDPLLAAAFATLPEPGKGRAGRGPRATSWVRRTSRGLEEPWLRRLVERGALRPERVKVLGLFPGTRFPAGSAERTTEAREHLAAAVRTGFAEPRGRALAALLAATGAARRLCPGPGGRPTRRAMRQLVRAEWPAFAVWRNVQRDRSADGG